MSDDPVRAEFRATGSPAARLKALLSEDRVLVAPGVVDAMSARLAARAGFEVLFATGAGIANTQFGLPDLGFTTLSEVVERIRYIARAVDIPVIADADTGYGSAMNVVRTVRQLEDAGAAGIMLEDQVAPKRCGHFARKAVIDVDEMLQKIRAFLYARRDPQLVLMARTDALAVHGLDEAIRRGQAFAKAGADLVFVEAPTSHGQLARIARSIAAPTVANMVEGGKTPLCSAAELGGMGFRVVLFANCLMRVAAVAMQDALRVLRADGTSAALMDRMLGWSERQELVGLTEFEALESHLATGTPAPEGPARRL